MATIKGETRLRIVRDDDPMNPREHDNLGTIHHWHNNLNLGDEQVNKPHDQDDYDELMRDYVFVLPVYCYEHGNVSINTEPFSCEWDSGQVGFIGVSDEDVRKTWCMAALCPIGKEVKQAAIKALEHEVREYNAYINGDVWGYIIEQASKCSCCDHIEWEHVDSCFGFYEDDVKTGVDDESFTPEFIEAAWEARE